MKVVYFGLYLVVILFAASCGYFHPTGTFIPCELDEKNNCSVSADVDSDYSEYLDDTLNEF